MQSVLEIDGATDDFARLLRELTEMSTVDDRALDALGHAFYRQGGVTRRCAAQIFHANRMMRDRHDGWVEFYLEALTDFFLDHQEDGSVLADKAGAMLLAWLGEGRSIADIGERRLALRLLLKADDVTEPFERRVFDALLESLLKQSARWLGKGSREAGMIDALDMQLIRRAVFGAGRRSPNKISSVAAEFLIELDRQVLSFKEPGVWRDFLIDALSRHLHGRVQPGQATALALDGELQACLKTWFDAGRPADEAAKLRHDVLNAVAGR